MVALQIPESVIEEIAAPAEDLRKKEYPPEVERWVLSGLDLFLRRSLEDAHNHFRIALSQVPSDGLLLLFMGITEAMLGLDQEALSHLDKALEEGEIPLAHVMKGLSLYHLGRVQESLKSFDAALELTNREPRILEIRRTLVDGVLRDLVRRRIISWTPGKPKGSTPPVPITPGQPVSDYVIEDRV